MKFLNYKLNCLKLWWFLPLWGLLLIGIIVGSFCDLQISKAIANPNDLFAAFLDNYGIMFGFAVVPLSGGMIGAIYFRKKATIIKRIFAILYSLVSIVLPTYFISGDFIGETGWAATNPLYLAYIVGIILYTAVYTLAFFITDTEKGESQIVRNAITIFFAVLIATLIANFLKSFAYRPRYRTLFWDNTYTFNGTEYTFTHVGESEYKNWWEFAFFHKPEWFSSITANKPEDFIKSWPSGHAAVSTILLLLPLFVNVTKFASPRKEKIVFFASWIIIFTISISRIFFGAHFLTDICFGILIESALFIIVMLIMQKIFSAIDKKKATKVQPAAN